ncbi:hypothetical protein ASG89_15390 [Paenibacillus sp. Soil766]|uniref:helix-turn-helix domain-containing protein n=1 Tax=Paenibacillus sp. Soil766 TaxID=1736404 RepID=UPI00070F0B41|nr:helix-turn-helix transcriptional regulator [Paenibacillus sp. Soil766]KRF09602.1 hypothetical protein ASG89_15390 [Paenibacillus sp. Soil766]
MNIIGENIKRLRKIHNLNQVDFSNLIGVSQGSLSDIEAGKSKPAVDTVVSIYKKFLNVHWSGCLLVLLTKWMKRKSLIIVICKQLHLRVS